MGDFCIISAAEQLNTYLASLNPVVEITKEEYLREALAALNVFDEYFHSTP